MFAPYQTPDFNAHVSHPEPARHRALAVEAYLDECEGRWKGKAEGYDFREQEPACGKRSPPRSSPSFVGDLPSLGNFDFSELVPAVLLTIHLDLGVSECLRPLAVPRFFGILTKSIEIWNRSSPKVCDSGSHTPPPTFAPPRVTCRASDLVPGSRCEPKSGLAQPLTLTHLTCAVSSSNEYKG